MIVKTDGLDSELCGPTSNVYLYPSNRSSVLYAKWPTEFFLTDCYDLAVTHKKVPMLNLGSTYNLWRSGECDLRTVIDISTPELRYSQCASNSNTRVFMDGNSC